MAILKRVKGFPVRIGGEQHTGWLPAGAAKPLPTPIRDVRMNIEIECDGSGYLMCFSSEDDSVYGDTWHDSLKEAEQAAAEFFGVRAADWTIGDEPCHGETISS